MNGGACLQAILRGTRQKIACKQAPTMGPDRESDLGNRALTLDEIDRGDPMKSRIYNSGAKPKGERGRTETAPKPRVA